MATIKHEEFVVQLSLVLRGESDVGNKHAYFMQWQNHSGGVGVTADAACNRNAYPNPNQVKIDFSRPGKPTDNAHVESFNGTLRAECLDAHWFSHLPEAAERIEAWRWEYNASRPHRALGERTPHEFARQIAASRDLPRLANAGD